jgi:Delta14-sterol reductase
VGWPEEGIWGLGSWKATGWTIAYYLFSAILYRVLPAEEATGTALANGHRLKYRFNGMAAPHSVRARKVPMVS